MDLYWILDIEISDAGDDQLRRPVAAPAHRRGFVVWGEEYKVLKKLKKQENI